MQIKGRNLSLPHNRQNFHYTGTIPVSHFLGCVAEPKHTKIQVSAWFKKRLFIESQISFKSALSQFSQKQTLVRERDPDTKPGAIFTTFMVLHVYCVMLQCLIDKPFYAQFELFTVAYTTKIEASLYNE